MIRIFTKERHVLKIRNYLNLCNLKFEIFTIKDNPPSTDFELGVSYCYPRKIVEPLLSTPKRGFVNYHPGPLPKYKGPNEFEEAIKNKEIHWGVTVHFMDKDYDAGPIIKVKSFDLHEPPTSIQELGAISHYFLFQLFKETVYELYRDDPDQTKRDLVRL